MSLSRRKKKTKLSPMARHSLLALFLVFVFTGFGFALFKVCSDRQAQFEGKLAELDQVNQEIQVLQTQNESLSVRVKLLKTDAGVEEVAREKLGLIKAGETAYSVLPPPPQEFIASDDLSIKYGAALEKEVDKDRGFVIRVLRHLFTPVNQEEQVST